MTDLEITLLCAEAMGYSVPLTRNFGDRLMIPHEGGFVGYSPLNNDEQAMALFKKLKLSDAIRDGSLDLNVENPNRVMCIFVANMQKYLCRAE